MAIITDTTYRHEISGTSVPMEVMEAAGDPVTLPEGLSLSSAEFDRVGDSLSVTGPGGEQVIIRGYFDQPNPPEIVSADGNHMSGELVSHLAGPLAPGQVAQIGAVAGSASIGTVESLDGSVVAVRADGTRVDLRAGDPVYQGDILETADGSAIGIVLADDTSFSMGENGRMVLDEMIYDPGTGDGSLGLSVVQGIFTFVSGQIAKTDPDAMSIDTPVATIGIRSTQVGIEVAEGGLVNVVLMEEADGFVGEVVVMNDGGVRILNGAFELTSISGFGAEPSQVRSMDEAELIDTYSQSLSHLPAGINSGNSYGLGGDDLAADFGDLADFETAAGADGSAPPPADGNIQSSNYTGAVASVQAVQAGAAPIAGAGGPTGGASSGGDDDQEVDGGVVPAATDDGSITRTVEGNYDGSGISANQNITGGGGADSIVTGAGDDVIVGSEGDDFLTGGAGDDAVTAGSGDDIIIGGSGEGDDAYDGGDGSDTVIYSSATDGISVDLAAGTASGTDIDDDTLTGIENVVGGAGDDDISGDTENNTITGGQGDDTIDGRGGDDTAAFSGNREDYEIARLESGAFRVTDTRAGGDGTDIIRNVETFEFADQSIDADDLIPGETIIGSNSSDRLTGGAGDDEIQGRSGHDTIDGGDGDDVNIGGAHNDTMSGGAGDDTFRVEGAGDGYDRFFGGEGTDRVVGSEGDDAIGIYGTFNADSSIEEIDGGDGFNIIQGTSSSDRMDFSGTTLTNIDELHGGSGHDTIIGSAGDDVIVGGDHNDTMFGGAGNDSFLFDASSDRDVIGDFGIGDALRFEGGEFSLDGLQIEQQGNNAVITFGGVNGVRVTLNDVDAAELQGYSVHDDGDAESIVIASASFG